MIGLASIALAACVAIPAASDSIVAGDVAASIPAFATLPADTVLGWAPAPGVRRVFRAAELGRLAARLGMAAAPEGDLCVERPVAPLDEARVRAALEKALPEAKIEILDFSQQPVPEGVLEFPLDGLRRGAGVETWIGRVRYAGRRRFAVWAKVRVRVAAPVVVAAQDLKPGQPIEAAQLRLQTREEFPASDVMRVLGDVTGKLPRHTIRAGAVVPEAALEEPPVVARGDTVTVEVRSGSARLELEGRAENAAGIGQRIKIRNPVSNKIFVARVEAKGRAVVGEGRP